MGVAGEFEDTSDQSAPPRLSPAMSSRKLIAFDTITRYFARWGHGPTLGELAALLGVSTKRAHDLVHQLARDDMIKHEAGKTRGIRLIDRSAELSEAEVLLRLSAMGWTVATGATVILPPGAADREWSDQALTNAGLSRLPVLDHDPGDEGEFDHG